MPGTYYACDSIGMYRVLLILDEASFLKRDGMGWDVWIGGSVGRWSKQGRDPS